ncbi:MAG: hypothetical protein ACR2P4_07305 [Gammaproteobacteria bacterium]
MPFGNLRASANGDLSPQMAKHESKALKGRHKTTAANDDECGAGFCRALPCKRMCRPFRAMNIKAPTLAGAALLLCNNAPDYRLRDNQ